MVIGKYRITPRGYVVFGSTGLILLLIIAMLMTQIVAPPGEGTNVKANSGSDQTQGSGNGAAVTTGTNTTGNATNGTSNTSGTTQSSAQGNTNTSLSQGEMNKILQSLRCTVYFKPDEYVLSEDFYGQLDEVVEMSKRFKDAKIILDGHFNGVPGEKTTEFRLSLAQNRAEMVKAYLISQGVESNRVIINNLGCTQPVNKDDSWQEIEKNRRVEVYFKSL